MKFLNHSLSLQSSHANFPKNFCFAKNGGFLQFFAKIAKHKNAYISKTVLDRAEYADFGCHNSIMLEAEHFLNTLPLTFISFSGCFVFVVQKHFLFFCKGFSSLYWPCRSSFVVYLLLLQITHLTVQVSDKWTLSQGIHFLALIWRISGRVHKDMVLSLFFKYQLFQRLAFLQITFMNWILM